MAELLGTAPWARGTSPAVAFLALLLAFSTFLAAEQGHSGHQDHQAGQNPELEVSRAFLWASLAFLLASCCRVWLALFLFGQSEEGCASQLRFHWVQVQVPVAVAVAVAAAERAVLPVSVVQHDGAGLYVSEQSRQRERELPAVYARMVLCEVCLPGRCWVCRRCCSD